MSDRATIQFITDLSDRDKNTDRRLASLETSEYSRLRFFHHTGDVLTGEIIAAGATYTSADMRLITSPNARGIIGNLWLVPQPAYTVQLYIGSSDDTPDEYSQRFRFQVIGGTTNGSNTLSQMVWIPLGKDGKFLLVAPGTNGGNGTFNMVIFGWWE